MQINSDSWLSDVEKHQSPNCSARPDPNDITLLVIHNISLPPQEYQKDWITEFFMNRLDSSKHPYFEEIKDLQVSAHCLIRRNGQLKQYVPFDKKAWHAGASCFDERSHCNDYSIGIELEGCDTEAYTAGQYQKLIQLTVLLMSSYPGITIDRIVGHNEIAPNRKTDPGPSFDWDYYKKQVR